MMKKILLEDALILNAIRAGRFWVRLLPLGFSYAFARAIGTLVYWTGKRRHDARRNLRMAFAAERSPGEMRRIARHSVHSIAMAAVDLLRVPEMRREDVEKRFTISGREHFEPYLKKGQGIIFLTGHYGSWELLNIVSGLVGYPMAALARVQKHPKSDLYLNELRRSKGSQVIHKGMPMREILKALKSGRIVGILSDQDGGKNGRFVQFFERMSSTPSGAAAFSLRTGAPIFPAFITRESHDCHRIEVGSALQEPPADWPEEKRQTHLLQQFASALEAKVRQAPGQWLWAHRRWKSSPDRRVLILSDGKAGHVNQSMAVLDAIRRERGSLGARVFSDLVEVKFKSGFIQKLVRLLSLACAGHLPLRRSFMRLALKKDCYERLVKTYADIVISCGSSLVDVNVWMKNENAARSVVVMKPSYNFQHFDAVIAPKHDKLASDPRVFQTEGALSSLRSCDLEVEAGVLSAELGLEPSSKRIGALIGGNTAALRFDPESFASLTAALADSSRRLGAQLLLTSSRRTPVWADDVLKKNLLGRPFCPMLLIANEANRPGAVAGILGLSDVLVVTAESMSMVSEAVSAGKPVLVVRPWKNSALKTKYEEYLERLERDGRISVCSPETFEDRLEKALSGMWPSPLDHRSQEELILGEAARRVLG
jgi:Kdo2-lipid IVA lauroyltransferase/acyltransferase